MHITHWLLSDRHLMDLNPLIAGEQRCAPGHSFGPHVRSYTLLHYVISGTGTFHTRGQSLQVGPGQVFVILPGEVTTYTADSDDPWHYRWIGFGGNLSHRFSELPPVFSLEKALFMDMFPKEKEGMEYRLAAGLMQLYARLFPTDAGANRHVQKVENLIQSSYMHPLRVEELARELNLDRRYLSRLFREQTGQSIQQYLINVRLEAADRQLAKGTSVQETARLCGYEDAMNFSRLYKKHRGKSPAKNKEKGRCV